MRNTSSIIPKITLSIALLFALQTAFAAVYPIDIKKNLHGTKVFATTSTIDAGGSTTTMKLTNFDERRVICRTTFDPRVEHPKTFKRVIEPQATTNLRHSTNRQINRLIIDLDCSPAQESPTDTSS